MRGADGTGGNSCAFAAFTEIKNAESKMPKIFINAKTLNFELFIWKRLRSDNK